MYGNGYAVHSADPAGFQVDQAGRGLNHSSSEPWQNAWDPPRAGEHGRVVGSFCEVISPGPVSP